MRGVSRIAVKEQQRAARAWRRQVEGVDPDAVLGGEEDFLSADSQLFRSDLDAPRGIEDHRLDEAIPHHNSRYDYEEKKQGAADAHPVSLRDQPVRAPSQLTNQPAYAINQRTCPVSLRDQSVRARPRRIIAPPSAITSAQTLVHFIANTIPAWSPRAPVSHGMTKQLVEPKPTERPTTEPREFGKRCNHFG